MRQPNPQEVRQQLATVFIGSGFVVIGFSVAFVLFRSIGFAQMLDTDVRSERQLAISLVVGLGLTSLLMCVWLWLSRRRKGGGRVA
jgi:hypothetical protein